MNSRTQGSQITITKILKTQKEIKKYHNCYFVKNKISVNSRQEYRRRQQYRHKIK